MQAVGLGRGTPRKHWPLEVVKKVVLDLMKEVPRSLLADYLLSTSAGAVHWWQRHRNFTQSVAVSSMVVPPLSQSQSQSVALFVSPLYPQPDRLCGTGPTW